MSEVLNIVLLGLENAGKTTLLNTLKGENQNGTSVWGEKIKSNSLNLDINGSGQWIADQSNGFKGTLNLQQNQAGGITGSVIWNGYLKGTIEGKITGDKIELTVDYHNGDIGYYKGTLAQNGTQIINGTVKGNNGVSANWNATKNTNSSPVDTWILNQNNGYEGILTITQNAASKFSGSIIWNGSLKGTVLGTINGDRIKFTISYPDGIKGIYEGVISSDYTKITSGTSRGNNGTSANWSGHR